jgi:dephospho-CoA kinase
VEAFGAGVLQADATLDRARLASMVFADAERRALLNSILHPLIIEAQDEELRRWEERDARGVAVVDAALMIESGGYKRFAKLIVVHCRPEIQLERLMRRNGLKREEAERRIDAQMPQAEKKRYADFLVDTSEGFEDTRRQVEEVYAVLRTLGEKKGAERSSA